MISDVGVSCLDPDWAWDLSGSGSRTAPVGRCMDYTSG